MISSTHFSLDKKVLHLKLFSKPFQHGKYTCQIIGDGQVDSTYHLLIDKQVSNSCSRLAMRKLLRELADGERHIQDGILMVNYEHPNKKI